ncbi:MAG TPA: hypothetical protein VF773_17375 [Verrucomicrobiae bacterium]
MKHLIRPGLLLLLLTAVVFGGCGKKVQPVSAGSQSLATDMIGTWVQVGTPGNVGEPPEKGGRFKHRTGTHWNVMSVNEEGSVTEIFGGNYTLVGDKYVETQEHSDARWFEDNGKSRTFRVSVEGELMTQIGVGNSYNEVWKRVRNDDDGSKSAVKAPLPPDEPGAR